MEDCRKLPLKNTRTKGLFTNYDSQTPKEDDHNKDYHDKDNNNKDNHNQDNHYNKNHSKDQWDVVFFW